MAFGFRSSLIPSEGLWKRTSGGVKRLDLEKVLSRALRLGQKRNVIIVRYVMKHTVKEVRITLIKSPVGVAEVVGCSECSIKAIRSIKPSLILVL